MLKCLLINPYNLILFYIFRTELLKVKKNLRVCNKKGDFFGFFFWLYENNDLPYCNVIKHGCPHLVFAFAIVQKLT